MNRPLFDPKHLRIAAEVRAKAWRRRWLNTATALVLLIVTLGVMVTIVVLEQIELHVRKLVQ
jgi:ABC-type lipoprotein release transport system permease subunit